MGPLVRNSTYILTMPPEAILDNYWETYPLDTMYDSWTVGQTILEFVLGTPDVFVPTTYEAFETLQEVEKLNLYHISRTRLAGMAEQCIEFPPFSQRVLKRMKTCSEEGYAMYIKERDPLNLGFPDVELLRLVRGLLNGDRDARMSVDEAIAHPYFTGQSSSFNYFGAVVMLMLCLITIYVARIVLEKVHQP